MTDMLDAISELIEVRRGHFRMESGLHTGRRLVLAPLFVHPERLTGLVAAFTDLLAPHAPDAICGPLAGGALKSLARGPLGRLSSPFSPREGGD